MGPSSPLSIVAAIVVAGFAARALNHHRRSARRRRHVRWVRRVGFSTLNAEMETAVRLAVECGEAMLSVASAARNEKGASTTLKDGKHGIDPQTATDLANSSRPACSFPGG